MNSQDSLWNVKANNGTASDIYHLQQQLQPQHSQSASLAGVASTASAPPLVTAQGGQPQQQALPNGYSMYDPASHHHQQQPQQYQTQQPQQQQPQHQTASHFRGGFVGNEDYTHYPYPDEYLNERNRQYVHAQATAAAAAGGDPYAAVNKPKHAECKFFFFLF